MPENYHIDREQRHVWSKCWGVLSDDDLLNHQARLKADPDFHASYSQMVDTTEVTEVTLTAKVVQQVAQNSIFAPESKRVFLVVKNIIFGLGRMFQLYVNIKGQNNIQVHRDRAKALAWLEVNEVGQLETPVTAPPN
jgi:hypothetical protein